MKQSEGTLSLNNSSYPPSPLFFPSKYAQQVGRSAVPPSSSLGTAERQDVILDGNFHWNEEAITNHLQSFFPFLYLNDGR